MAYFPVLALFVNWTAHYLTRLLSVVSCSVSIVIQSLAAVAAELSPKKSRYHSGINDM